MFYYDPTFPWYVMYTHLQPIVVRLHLQLSVVEVLGIMETTREGAEEAAEQLERLLFILHTLVSYRDGAKVTKPESVCQVGGARLRLSLLILSYNRCWSE